MNDESESTNAVAGYTAQGQMVSAHWSRMAVTYEGALESLRSNGIDPDNVTVEDLHSLDMMHMGGLAATDSLCEMAGLQPGHKVLDVGSGIGGPARRMASRYGASVWGVDLSETQYRTATRFTELVGLQDRVRFKHGSALALPFEDNQFDVLVIQHVAMQISEKDQLFGECARVIRSGGSLAMHELFGTEGTEPHFPLPWATEPAMSALETLDECFVRLGGLGFEVGEFVDLSEEGQSYHQERANAFRSALAQNKGAEGFSVEVTESRIRTSESMALNLRTDLLKVGMIVSRKTKS